MERADRWMTPAELARLEERRIARAIADVARESIEVAGGTVCFGGEGSWMNEGRGLGLSGEVRDDDVERAISFLKERGAKARFDVCPHAHPSLVRALGARGLRVLGFETVLYRPLEDDVLGLAPQTDFEIVRVGEVEVDAFVDGVSRWFTVEEGAGGEGRAPTDVEAWSFRRVLEHPRVEAYLVRAEGRFIGGGALEVWPLGALGPGDDKGGDAGGLAALIMTSVAPDFRRRGVQRALMAHRLKRARELGATTAVIGSDPSIATERNALRMGFRVAYTKVALGQP